MKALFTLGWLVLAIGSSVVTAAEPQRDGPAPPVISRARQPIGTPHKSSAFAPQPGAKRKVYGAPIQKAIVHDNTPKKPQPR